MNILFCASEAVPFIKTGGLADVAGSLPLEIKKQGHDIKVVLPLYNKIDIKYRSEMEFLGYFYVDLDFRHQYAGIYRYIEKEVEFYFIDSEFYFARNNIYGEGDDCERFMFFSKACTLLAREIGFKPDIVHSNDWHTALVNIFIRDFAKGDEFYRDIKTVYTIHNLKYQGIFPADALRMSGLDPIYYNEEGLKYFDSINLMKGGIIFCDRLITVSGTYALEIKYPFFGEGLDGVILKYDYKLRGIVNGIDYEVWNPEKDPYLKENYTLKTVDKKKENKKEIQKRFGLPEKDVPMIAMISRLVEMKGLELVRYMIDHLLATKNVQFVLLGTGDYQYEEMFRYFNWRYPEKLSARIYYNEEESHQLYSGADFLLMPSLAEPCGISQLIAMRYGTIPIVRETGGLKDTVIPYNKYTKEGTGFSFTNINGEDLLYTIKSAIHYYHKEDAMKHLISNAMKAKNDWEESATNYIGVYQEIK